MSSPTRAMREREEERRLSIRTLAIASVAAAAAAIVTSQFWVAGTPIAAAITPVIVALISELLHRPTAVIAERLTVDRTAVLPPKGAAPPEPVETEPQESEAPVRVYRREPAPRRKRRIALGVVVTTAVLAFAVAAVALTIPELITGGSIGKGDRDTTLFGGRDRGQDEDRQEAPATTPSEDEDTQPQTPTETAPEQTETAPQTETQTETVPTTPSGKTPPGG